MNKKRTDELAASFGRLGRVSLGELEGNIDQADSYQHQGNSDKQVGIEIPEIKIAHSNFLSSLNDIHQKKIAKTKSLVKNQTSFNSLTGQKLGETITNPNQAADKLPATADKDLMAAWRSFLEEKSLTENESHRHTGGGKAINTPSRWRGSDLDSWKVEETGGVSIPPVRWKTRNLPRIITFIIFITVIFLAGGARVAHATDITNIGTIFITGMILLCLLGSLFLLKEGYVDKKENNHKQGVSNSRLHINISKVNFSVYHSFLSSKAITRESIADAMFIVKSRRSIRDLVGLMLIGNINATPNQPADILINSSDNTTGQRGSILPIILNLAYETNIFKRSSIHAKLDI